jgi:hypothetical protein
VGVALSEILIFKLFQTETTAGTVTMKPIVIALDIIKPCCPHYFPAGKVLSVDTFLLQRVEEAFHTGIVVTTASTFILPRR